MKKLLKFRAILTLLTAFGLANVNAQCDSICRSASASKVFYVSGLNANTVVGYKWSIFAAGVVINSGQGTDTIKLDFRAAALGQGRITVRAYNNCDSTELTDIKFEIYDCKVKDPIKIDTVITPKDTTVIVVTKPVDTALVKVRIVGPFHGSGTASVNSANGVVTFVPNKPPFVGKDSILKIVTTTKDGKTTIDTSIILIIGNPAKVVVSDSTNSDVAKILAPLPARVFQGSNVSNSFRSTAGGGVIFSSTGVITYTPPKGFVGVDTIRIVRCDNLGNCDTAIYVMRVDYFSQIIANYISPNGDGVNDVWNIDGILKTYPNAKVIIYNRWGNTVWRSTGPYGKVSSGTNVWSGQLEGSKDFVPDGVYYYLLDLEDNMKTTKTGFIEVMRQ